MQDHKNPTLEKADAAINTAHDNKKSAAAANAAGEIQLWKRQMLQSILHMITKCQQQQRQLKKVTIKACRSTKIEVQKTQKLQSMR
eukprot:12773752-Ditylum_brightwellii.AAC.1